MNNENPLARKPVNQEVDTSWVDLADGKLGAKGSVEVSPVDIESAESRLNASTARLQENIAKPVAEQNEAAELLKKMHKNAGIKQETATVTPNAEKKKEKPPIKEAALSPEQVKLDRKVEDAKKLYESLDLRSGGIDDFGSRKSAENNAGEGLISRIEVGLDFERSNHKESRNKLLVGTETAATAVLLTSLGGLIASGTEATIFGYSGATLAAAGFSLGAIGLAAAAAGVLGWAGMKAYHALKERRHEKALDELLAR